MIDELLREVAASPVAIALKTSRYAYPVVNAIHIMGLATLFGAIVALNLRLLGIFASLPVQPLAALLPRVAAGGLLTALASGVLLFSVQPIDYAGNRAFLLKIGLVAAASLHALAVHRTAAWRSARGTLGIVRPGLRASALLSTLLWTGAIMAGRFIGFE